MVLFSQAGILNGRNHCLKQASKSSNLTFRISTLLQLHSAVSLADLVSPLHHDLAAEAEAGNEPVILFSWHPFNVGSKNEIDQELRCLKRERQRTKYHQQHELSCV